MVQIAPGILLDESEIQEDFIRSSGPGGQNVNKLATAVQIRLDAAKSRSLAGLDERVRNRLATLAGKKMSKEGVLVITARRFRTQEANRRDAIDRLVELIRRATEVPTTRRGTRPTKASIERRLEAKRRRGHAKGLRKADFGDEG
jgi:ribosome-associated protein